MNENSDNSIFILIFSVMSGLITFVVIVTTIVLLVESNNHNPTTTPTTTFTTPIITTTPTTTTTLKPFVSNVSASLVPAVSQVVCTTSDNSWSANTAPVGGTVTQACNGGGTRTATCRADQSWAITTSPDCLCTASDGWSNKTAPVGKTVIQTCKGGGTRTATCNAEKSWSITSSTD